MRREKKEILILGGAGVLGSLLAHRLSEFHKITVVDIVRPYEAWRLHENRKNSIINIHDNVYKITLTNGKKVDYIWSYAENVSINYDIVIDAAIGNADRPMGLYSSKEVAMANLSVPLSIYKKYKDPTKYNREKGGIIIYPSSFNSMYGHSEIKKDKLPDPSSLYGWTKAAAELLYRSLAREKNAKIVITRVGSAFGPRGRSDELPHRLIIDMLNNKDTIHIMSPYSKRLWTYAEDIAEFYEKLIDNLEVKEGEMKVYHVAGNKHPGAITNMELLYTIAEIVGWNGAIDERPYEPGEIVNNRPIDFEYETDITPKYTLMEGLEKTVEWFKQHKQYYAMG